MDDEDEDRGPAPATMVGEVRQFIVTAREHIQEAATRPANDAAYWSMVELILAELAAEVMAFSARQIRAAVRDPSRSLPGGGGT